VKGSHEATVARSETVDRGRNRALDCPAPPLRTVHADFSHTALQSVVFSITETGDFQFPGFLQAEEAQSGEVVVGPAMVIQSSASAFGSPALAQD